MHEFWFHLQCWELKHPIAPKAVREWAINPPDWLEVMAPTSTLILDQLDSGEGEAIALAAEVHADIVLIDEQAGRREAQFVGPKSCRNTFHSR